MAIITLTTDFGNKDFSVAAVKGAIYKQNRNVNVVDISHEITPFHIYEAAYVLENACFQFPDNSIHIIGVDAERSEGVEHVIAKIDNQFFVCTDNGIISLLTQHRTLTSLVKIDQFENPNQLFPELNIFAKVAAFLAKGVHLTKLGSFVSGLKEISPMLPSLQSDKKQVMGKVIYIDNYGNVVTDITKDFFDEVREGRSFVIEARSVKIKEIHTSYSAAVEDELKKGINVSGKKMAIFNSSNHLELAIYKSNPKTTGAANTLFGLQYMDVVKIVFDSN